MKDQQGSYAMLNPPTGTIAILAIQCKSANDGVGDFIYLCNEKAPRPPSQGLTLSPVFTNLMPLFDWLKANSWEEMPYCKAFPTGRYIKR